MNRCSQQSAAQNVVTLRIMAATEPRTPEGDPVGQPPDWPLFIDKAGRLPHLYQPVVLCNRLRYVNIITDKSIYMSSMNSTWVLCIYNQVGRTYPRYNRSYNIIMSEVKD